MIRVGIGGWTFEPWRGTFFPRELRKREELGFASRRLSSLEVNGTFYRTQTPSTFRQWADETPPDFVFALKGARYVVSRARLAEAGPGLARFFESGVTELGPKLGPILWQFAPTRRFAPDDIAAFLELLPRQVDGLAIRHVIEVRHESFRAPEFIALLRASGVAVAYADSDTYPAIADPVGGFVYARLQRCLEHEPTGYPADALDLWAQRVRTWADGRVPPDLPRVVPGDAPPTEPRPCFVYFISGAKVRAPAAALALLERLGR